MLIFSLSSPYVEIGARLVPGDLFSAFDVLIGYLNSGDIETRRAVIQVLGKGKFENLGTGILFSSVKHGI